MIEANELFDYQIERTEEGVKWVFFHPYRSTHIISSDKILTDEYITFLSKNSGITPDRIEKTIRFMLEKNSGIVYGKNCYHHWGKVSQ